MKESEWMDQFVYDLLEHYEAEVLSSGLLYLELTMDGYGVLVIEEKLKHRTMSVCYWLYDAQGHPVAKPSLLFHIDDSGHWLPYEIRRHTGGQHVFEVVEDAYGAFVATDPASQESLAAFADQWAEVLRGQGWIGSAEKAVTQPQAWPEEEEAPFMPPSVAELWTWVGEHGKCMAMDGCWVAVDETCEHGFPSWLLELGPV
jgi:hypothetical protein